jgi:hypothetical protein
MSQFATPDDEFAEAPGTYFALLPSEDRVIVVNEAVFSVTSGGDSAPFWTTGWVGSTPAAYGGGPITADVRALSPADVAEVSFADGHVAALDAKALAAGTNFSTSNSKSGLTCASGTATGAVINGLMNTGRSFGSGCTNATGLAAPNNYLWTLDGTLSDIN